MTHNDIYTKFMIEYDKADVTSSYPSITQYEAATILDKAYLALIAQKITGNNVRRVGFEYDIKSIEDLRPLIVEKNATYKDKGVCDNEYIFNTPSDMLYYLEGTAKYDNGDTELVIPVNHQMARNFKATNTNIPWIKQPVFCMEEDGLHMFIDPYKHANRPQFFKDVYIKRPHTFVKTLTADYIKSNYLTANEYTQIKGQPTLFKYNLLDREDPYYNGFVQKDVIEKFGSIYEFELSDTMAEELISLAITFALENVEAARLNNKLNTRGLEG